MSDDREELEAEREFLLRSLDDLDSELVAGNIDPDTYRVLHDDYTARASAVIRSLDDGVDRHAPDAPRVPPWMRVLTVGGIVVFAALAAVLLAHAVGQRNPGQTITGNAQVSGSPTTLSPAAELEAAKEAAAAQPKSYDAVIRYARALLPSGDPATAIQEYVAASKLDPTQAEPRAVQRLDHGPRLRGRLRTRRRSRHCSTRPPRASTRRSPSIRPTLTRTCSRVCCSRSTSTSSARAPSPSSSS